MNFLAHLYLSGEDEQVIIGNFIGDHVRSLSRVYPLQRTGELYSEGIIKGVKLHRLIDAFTDSHPLVELGKKRLRPYFHKYAPVITDVFYDHFLARNWNNYHHRELNQFAQDMYSLMAKNEQLLPEKTKYMLSFMIKNNWLVSYATLEGINRALTGLSRRAKFDSNMDKATTHLEKDYRLYENEFKIFFEELKEYCSDQLKML